jgi:hypothetical protein
VFLRAVCGFLSIFFVLELIGDRERMVERFAVAIILLTTCSHTFLRFVEPFAQPTSTAVFVLGLWLNRIKAPSRIWHVFQALAITILFWISFWVNISLPTLVIPLLGAFWQVGIEIRLYRRAFFIALVAALGAYVHSQFFDPKTPIVFVFDTQSISAALTEVQSEILWERLLIVVLVVFCLIVVISIAKQRALPSVLPLPLAHALTLCVAAGNIALLASVQHVQTNGNAMRYYIVTMIIYEVILASWIFSALLATVVSVMPRVLQVFIRYALPISALGFVFISVGPPKPMRFASDIADKKFAINDDATMVADFVKTD